MPAAVIIVAAAVTALAIVLAVILMVRRRRAAQPTAFIDINTLRQLSWAELEILIADYFVREGFIVREQGGKAVDMVIEKADRRFLVQCKHWRNAAVDAREVRDVFGHMAATGAAGAFLITSGRFTPAAVEYASGKRIELVDGNGLARMVEEVQRDPSEITQSRLDAIRDADETQPRRVILCPRCGRRMSRRRERTADGWREFYGCSRYPTCKGRRAIA